MRKLVSAKWVILLTVLINIVTTFSVMTLFPTGILATARITCSTNSQVFGKTFKSSYSGTMKSNGDTTGPIEIIANIKMTFSGKPPVSRRNSGGLTAASIQVTATSNGKQDFDLENFTASTLDKNNSQNKLDNFELDIDNDNGGTITFTGGAFLSSGSISGTFDIEGGGIDSGDKGTWSVH